MEGFPAVCHDVICLCHDPVFWVYDKRLCLRYKPLDLRLGPVCGNGHCYGITRNREKDKGKQDKDGDDPFRAVGGSSIILLCEV